MEAEANKKNIANIIWLIFKILCVVAQAVVSVMSVISLLKMEILAEWIMAVVIVVLILLLALNIILLIVRKKTALALQIVCVILSLAVVAGGIFVMRYTSAFNRFLDKITIEEEPSEVVEEKKDITKDPFMVYISGIDSRDGYAETSLSDVNIVTVVNPEKGKILLASVPRDTYLQLHGTTGLKDKLTHAGWYGLEMSKTTIEDFLDITIDYTIKVSFDAVVGIVNQLDGIEIYSDVAMNLKATGGGKMCYYTVGTQLVDGACALRFARERKTYYTGDLHRGANQQEIITSVIKKLSNSKEYLLKIPEILDVVADSMETSLSQDEITSFIRLQLNNQIDWQVESIDISGEAETLPTYSLGKEDPKYVMIPDEASVQNMRNRINEYLEK